jgi:hypothetical protein
MAALRLLRSLAAVRVNTIPVHLLIRADGKRLVREVDRGLDGVGRFYLYEIDFA